MIILAMTICTSSNDVLDDKIKEMKSLGWTQSTHEYFNPCESMDTEEKGIYTECFCVQFTKKEITKRENE